MPVFLSPSRLNKPCFSNSPIISYASWLGFVENLFISFDKLFFQGRGSSSRSTIARQPCGLRISKKRGKTTFQSIQCKLCPAVIKAYGGCRVASSNLPRIQQRLG